MEKILEYFNDNNIDFLKLGLADFCKSENTLSLTFLYDEINYDKLNENRTSEIKNRSIEAKAGSKSIENKTNLSRQESVQKEDRQIRNQGLQDLIKILLIRELINNSGFRPRPPAPPRPPVPPPPPPRPGRPPRPPMGPGPGRPPFNRSMYEQDYDIYEY